MSSSYGAVPAPIFLIIMLDLHQIKANVSQITPKILHFLLYHFQFKIIENPDSPTLI